MRIFYERESDNTLFSGSAVALGSFEALHAGHIQIIKSTVECAEKNNIQSVVTIFKEPVLKTRTKVCETLEDRLKILKKLSVDNVVIFEFDDEFRKMTDTDFFEKIIKQKLGAKHIFAGFNYRFGHNACGNTDTLLNLCSVNNISLSVVPAVKKGIVISSTHIYDLIISGNAKELLACLLRPYSISGKITHGREIGRKIGFPTANIEIPDNKAVIKNGVYLGKCHLEENSFFCIINIGPQPTVTDEFTPKIEVHILDFEGDIYGREIRIDFYERIRDIAVFKNTQELKAQLISDKETAYKLLSRHNRT